LNPYQGLKHTVGLSIRHSCKVPITLNPYQGLKRWIEPIPVSKLNVPITLNPYQGLKRTFSDILWQHPAVPITLNPYQGLKPGAIAPQHQPYCSNNLESLSGIETSSSLLKPNRIRFQ